MRSQWYVLATTRVGRILLMRIVAGPLSLDEATYEAQQRVRISRADVEFSTVELDPMFGLAGSMPTANSGNVE